MTNDARKPVVYTSRDGTKFWVSVDDFRIETDQPDTYLQEHHDGPFRSVFKRLVLVLDGYPIEFSGPNGLPYERRLVPNPGGEKGNNENPPMRAIWRISGLGPLGKGHFANRKQQDQAVALLTDILKNFSRNWATARLGFRQSATVEFSEDFEKALESGDYIKGE